MSRIWLFDPIETKHTLRGLAKNVTDFEKKKTVNKRKTKIISRCKSMLHLWKNSLKKNC